MTIQEYYAEVGHFVIACSYPLPLGLIQNNDDWHEKEMAECRWSVIGDATREDLNRQNLKCEYADECSHEYRFFYRVVALD